MRRLAGIELGGTKTIVVLGSRGIIAQRIEFATTSADKTLGHALEALARWHAEEPLDALGIASFGPVRVNRDDADYGRMLDTPKPGWSDAAIVAPFAQGLGCPLALDTDVNAAALGEYHHGAGTGCSSLAYITIGTGIGGGVLVGGEPVPGMLHPELGHMRLRRASGDRFAGACRFHGDCIEGLLSGPALAARFDCHPGEIAADDPRWQPVVHDLAELIAMLILALSPQRIIIGGGVSQRQPHLLACAREQVPAILGGYLRDCTPQRLAQMIVPPMLGGDAGPMGALELAARAYDASRAAG